MRVIYFRIQHFEFYLQLGAEFLMQSILIRIFKLQFLNIVVYFVFELVKYTVVVASLIKFTLTIRFQIIMLTLDRFEPILSLQLISHNLF